MFQPGGSIRAVLFDAVGTLIRPNPPVAEAYLTAARRFGVDGGLTEAEVDRRFRAAFARQEMIDRQANWRTDEVREFQRWDSIVNDVFGTTANQSGLLEYLWNHFADARNWTIDESLLSMIVAAAKHGLLVAVASNFDARLRRIIENAIDSHSITHIFVSSEIGHRKPSIEFFRAIESSFSYRPHYFVLVGDDEENDIAGARAAGWSTILFDGSPGRLVSQLSQLRFDPQDIACHRTNAAIIPDACP
jgi:putative hydrolase of the HAD superfamily